MSSFSVQSKQTKIALTMVNPRNKEASRAKQSPPAKAQPSQKKPSQIDSERSKGYPFHNPTQAMAKPSDQQDRPLFFCVKKLGGL